MPPRPAGPAGPASPASPAAPPARPALPQVMTTGRIIELFSICGPHCAMERVRCGVYTLYRRPDRDLRCGLWSPAQLQRSSSAAPAPVRLQNPSLPTDREACASGDQERQLATKGVSPLQHCQRAGICDKEGLLRSSLYALVLYKQAESLEPCLSLTVL